MDDEQLGRFRAIIGDEQRLLDWEKQDAIALFLECQLPPGTPLSSALLEEMLRMARELSPARRALALSALHRVVPVEQQDAIAEEVIAALEAETSNCELGSALWTMSYWLRSQGGDILKRAIAAAQIIADDCVIARADVLVALQGRNAHLGTAMRRIQEER
jgi:hypothetical protein